MYTWIWCRTRWRINQVSHGKGVKRIPASGEGLGGGSTRLVMGKGFCVFLGDGGGSISLVGGDCDNNLIRLSRTLKGFGLF